MKLSTAALLFLTSSSSSIGTHGLSISSRSIRPNAFVHGAANSNSHRTSICLGVTAEPVTSEVSTALDYESIQKLPYRGLQQECKSRGLSSGGNTAALRARLMEDAGIVIYCKGDDTDVDECVTPPDMVPGIAFEDASDPDFEFKSRLSEIMEKSSIGHWKAASRKLKQLSKRYVTPERPVPEEAYVAVLEACSANRLQGARAAESCRKIMEDMTEQGIPIATKVGNYCVVNCLGNGPNGTHDGHGGIDTALAILAALETSRNLEGSTTEIYMDTYGDVVSALAKDGSVDEAVLLLRAMVVDHSFTPSLSTFADVAAAAAKAGKEKAEVVLTVMTLVKAAGYELDTIGSAQSGRSILASGVIAAELIDNLALGLRLLTAAGKAEGCAPDRGDDLVAASSSAAQRASTLIHKRAIDKAVAEDNWKLAVKVLQLMPERSLTPAPSVWRKVVTLCAKCEKSRKATSLLLDWVKLYEEDKAEKPPISVFNTVVNTCEICGEEELTVIVLEAMKKIHDTEGNIITFNIALKRLAKLGNTRACEGIIVGMLQEGVEPSVVSYTTAIGACAKEGDSALAYEWLQRMRSRNVMPNFHTYNTALAACLVDGKLESTVRGSKIATMMLEDINKELAVGFKGSAEYKSVLPDTYTKTLAIKLMKQLRENWRAGDINMKVAKATVRVPLLKIVDFEKSEAAALVKKQLEEQKLSSRIEITDTTVESGEELEAVEQDESDIEFAAVNKLHKEGRRNIEV